MNLDFEIYIFLDTIAYASRGFVDKYSCKNNYLAWPCDGDDYSSSVTILASSKSFFMVGLP